MTGPKTEDNSPIGRIFGAVVPKAVGAIDPDDLIERVDLNAVLERIDLDKLMDRIDIERLLDRIDIDGIVRRVDLDSLLARLDLNEVMDRVDIDRLIGRVDVDAMIGKVDVNAMVGRVDLNGVIGQVDLKAVVLQAGIDDIVADASTGVATKLVDLARRQLLGLDLILMGAVDRVFRRPRPAVGTGPVSASGRPAGPITRLLAFLVDAGIVAVLFSLAAGLGTALLSLFTGDQFQITKGGSVFWTLSYFAWWGLYLWASIVIAGRTPGKALLGMRVTTLTGRPVGPGRAAVRTIVYPFSFILGLGFIPMIVRRDRRALHELASGTSELTDWGERAAELPMALQGWLQRKSEEARAGAAVPGATEPLVVSVSAGTPGPAGPTGPPDLLPPAG